jgi:DNA repair protein RecO (recombination protein O)
MITTDGIVISKKNIMDSDIIITLLTKKFGKINVYCKGAKSPKNKLNKGVELFSYGEYDIGGSKEYKLFNVEIKDSFYGLRENQENLYFAYYLLELINNQIDISQNNKLLYELLIKNLYFLTYSDVSWKKLKNYFDISILKILGLKPTLSTCSICSNDVKSAEYFSISDNGVVCDNCIKNMTNGLKVNEKVLKYMEFCDKTDIVDFVRKDISSLLIEKMDIILNSYLIYHLKVNELKSYKFIKE